MIAPVAVGCMVGGAWVVGFFLGRFSKPEKPVTAVADVEFTCGDYLVIFSNGTSYFGNCTVWHSYETGRRASTSIESICADRIAWRKFKEKTAKSVSRVGEP